MKLHNSVHSIQKPCYESSYSCKLYLLYDIMLHQKCVVDLPFLIMEYQDHIVIVHSSVCSSSILKHTPISATTQNVLDCSPSSAAKCKHLTTKLKHHYFLSACSLVWLSVPQLMMDYGQKRKEYLQAGTATQGLSPPHALVLTIYIHAMIFKYFQHL